MHVLPVMFSAAIASDAGSNSGCAGWKRQLDCACKAHRICGMVTGCARDMLKRRGEAYRLLWQRKVDYVDCARCHAVIMPFAAVRADDAFDVYMATDEVLANPMLGLLAHVLMLSAASAVVDLGEAVMPVPKVCQACAHFHAAGSTFQLGCCCCALR